MNELINNKFKEYIIDSHSHIYESGKWIYGNKVCSIQRLLDEMEETSVKKTILIAIDGIISNEFVSKACSAYPDSFFGFCSVNPLSMSNQELIKLIKSNGFIGIKLHPRLQKIRLNDPKVVSFFKEVEEKIPTILLIDCFFTDHEEDNLVQETIDFINHFNKLNIIMAHAGGFEYKRIIPLANKKNIFLDTAMTLNVFHKYSKPFIEDFIIQLRKVGSSKIIFGSDYPCYSISENYNLWNFYLEKHGFSESEKKEIFCGTITKIINETINKIKRTLQN